MKKKEKEKQARRAEKKGDVYLFSFLNEFLPPFASDNRLRKNWFVLSPHAVETSIVSYIYSLISLFADKSFVEKTERCSDHHLPLVDSRYERTCLAKM